MVLKHTRSAVRGAETSSRCVVNALQLEPRLLKEGEVDYVCGQMEDVKNTKQHLKNSNREFIFKN